MININTDIQELNRVGKAIAKILNKIGIKTVNDLLFYFPYRYDDFSEKSSIKNLRPGSTASIIGNIQLIQNRRSYKKKMQITEALVGDDSGEIKVIWFNQPFITRALKIGDEVSLAGKVESGYAGASMISPVYERINSKMNSAIHTQGIIPNYHLTKNLTQKQLRYLVKQSLDLLGKIIDWLPAEIQNRAGLYGLESALREIHFPQNWNTLKQARDRLAFDELFILQLQSLLIRRDLKSNLAPKIIFREEYIKNFVNDLPFKLTNSQRKSAWEIIKDMENTEPMTRLLIGDVGSGKTIVAFIAIINALNKVTKQKQDNDKNDNLAKQAVIMAPTEILARQHYFSALKFFKKYGLKIALLTGSELRIENISGKPFENKDLSRSKADKKQLLELINNGEVDLLIGTHAVIQKEVKFKRLLLAVIDEQHRFGVEQRKELLDKSGLSKLADAADPKVIPHLLSMTATPIPRSLALSVYGDLDISVINEMPTGRKKIITRLVTEEKRDIAYKFIHEKIRAGRQAFVICPLIDISDKLGMRSVNEEYEKLHKKVFPDLNIAMLHGKMKPAEKEKVMEDFIGNKINILVSTSVIEVGIDIPNAALMIIEGAERFGLSQLHQFRGRIGRGEHQSFCLLFSESRSENSLKRLNALIGNNDGYELAKLDLKFRGPGEIFGIEQKGFLELKVANLFDQALMEKAKNEAHFLFDKDQTLDRWPELKLKLDEVLKKVHLE